MGLVERTALIVAIAPPIDMFLATQLVDEFVSAERRYIQRDWEPTELDGGQFSEILGRILYHQDSGTPNLGKDFGECAEYVEDLKSQHSHNITPRHNAIHLMRVLRTIYKLRSQRGAVHVSPTYQANHMDAKLVIECVRWSMNETLRLFWTGDRERVARTIRELLQFDVPCIGTFEGAILVQRTDLNAEEEVLVLLHYAGEKGFTRKELGQHCKASPPAVTRAVQRLESPDCRQIVGLATGAYRLTDLGAKRIREHLADKLLLA